MSAKAYQKLLMKRRKKAFPHIDRRAKELRRNIRFLTLVKMIDGVNLIQHEIEHIARSNHLWLIPYQRGHQRRQLRHEETHNPWSLRRRGSRAIRFNESGFQGSKKVWDLRIQRQGGMNVSECELCGATEQLEKHHIKRRHKFKKGEVRNFPENIQILCHDCHMKIHHPQWDWNKRKEVSENEWRCDNCRVERTSWSQGN